MPMIEGDIKTACCVLEFRMVVCWYITCSVLFTIWFVVQIGRPVDGVRAGEAAQPGAPPVRGRQPGGRRGPRHQARQ